MVSLARYGRLMKAKLKIAEDAAGKAAAARLAKAAWCTVGPREGKHVENICSACGGECEGRVGEVMRAEAANLYVSSMTSCKGRSAWLRFLP